MRQAARTRHASTRAHADAALAAPCHAFVRVLCFLPSLQVGAEAARQLFDKHIEELRAKEGGHEHSGSRHKKKRSSRCVRACVRACVCVWRAAAALQFLFERRAHCVLVWRGVHVVLLRPSADVSVHARLFAAADDDARRLPLRRRHDDDEDRKKSSSKRHKRDRSRERSRHRSRDRSRDRSKERRSSKR